ncbi:DUF3140 domain-containing protein [Iamia sp.]|uniref:DUF3140 domain-containing protein n=1 Tax=Iamia sp. TaxID=2722710 RepID=UPI002BF752D4|nr:DUF3140 domain-containing protein [Iamia sp.]HXH59395.1 DUF3140 domain-containing protein [Iamia sp.]
MATDDDVIADFAAAVNMTGEELESWLDTEESKSVGRREPGDESVGHHSGRRIVTLLGKDNRDDTDGDVAHMRKVVGAPVVAGWMS